MRCTARTPGLTVTFDVPEGGSILDAALAAGWELPYSCRRGNCEGCRAHVISGEVYPPPAADGTALLCCAKALSDVEIEPLRIEKRNSDEPETVTGKLYRVRWPAEDVAIVDIRFPAGCRVKFEAGQYLSVVLEGHAPRSFSMANAPRSNDGVQLHVRILPDALFGGLLRNSHLKPGDPITVTLPFGDFRLREAAGRPVILVAGGTGFAPMQSLLEDALGKYPDREFTLYWGARTQAGLYALDQVARWQRRHKNFRFIGVISDEPARGDWRSGLVHEAVCADFPDLGDYDVYVCGSPGLVQAARQAFGARGLPPDRFFSDSFTTSSEAAV